MTIRNLKRLGRQAVVGGGLLLGVASGGAVYAQPMVPGAPAPTSAQTATPMQRNYLNKRIIQLPIQIAEAARNSIQEIQLFVKDSPNSPWTLSQSVAPSQKAFSFQSPHDGEYWFTMVTLDKQGRKNPADIRNEPPGLAVIIDTEAPAVELTNLGNLAEGQIIQVDVSDPNLDAARVRFSYQSGDKGFRTLDPVPGKNNVYCIPAQAVCTGLVQVIAEDLAGNQTTRQETLTRMKTPTQAAGVNASTNPVPIPDPTGGGGKTPNSLPKELGAAPPIGPETQTHQTQKVTPQSAPERSNLPRPGSEDRRWTDDKNTPGARSEADPKRDTAVQQTNHIVASAPSTTNKTLAQKVQLLNNPKLSLQYQIENAGPNAISRVEIWLSRDQGQSWQKHTEVPGNKSPIEFHLPGDGVFGMILTPLAGSAPSTPPSAADQADAVWLEVDSTRPSLQINDVQTSHDKGQTTVTIRWTAQDKNLGEGPVDLFYAATQQGPWVAIAKGLPAEGTHRWTPPAGLGAQVHLQLVAHDAVGNTAVIVTSEPVTIAEQARPRAVIRTISTGQNGPQLP